MSGLDDERVVLSGGPLGIMAAAMDVVVPHKQERRQSDGAITTRIPPACILYAAEEATQAVLDAVQLLGGNDYPTGRLRDATLYEIGPGMGEIRRWLIGREIKGESV